MKNLFPKSLLRLPWRRYRFFLRPLAKPMIVHKSDAGRRFISRSG